MGRKPVEKPSSNKEIPYKVCTSCKKNKDLNRQYFKSANSYDGDGRVNICKDCLKKNMDYENIQTVKDALLQINKPFIYSLWISSVEEAHSQSTMSNDIFGCYMKSLYLNFKDLTWKDSDETDPNKTAATDISATVEVIDNKTNSNLIVLEDKNKEDVIRMVGYDPFETENEADKRHLYNKLVDFLDEGTLEDSFKLPTVIEIVKTFNQIDKINAAMSIIASNTKALTENVGGLKSLGDTKNKLLKSVLDLAKDNGISVNHNNNKSKGAGTLTGIIKQLQEKGFQEAAVNIFDIETSAGMSQVADISNRSILSQLQFDENDYSDMLMQQREIITELREKVESLEEENRLLKIKFKTVADNEE